MKIDNDITEAIRIILIKTEAGHAITTTPKMTLNDIFPVCGRTGGGLTYRRSGLQTTRDCVMHASLRRSPIDLSSLAYHTWCPHLHSTTT